MLSVKEIIYVGPFTTAYGGVFGFVSKNIRSGIRNTAENTASENSKYINL